MTPAERREAARDVAYARGRIEQLRECVDARLLAARVDARPPPEEESTELLCGDAFAARFAPH